VSHQQNADIPPHQAPYRATQSLLNPDIIHQPTNAAQQTSRKANRGQIRYFLKSEVIGTTEHSNPATITGGLMIKTDIKDSKAKDAGLGISLAGPMNALTTKGAHAATTPPRTLARNAEKASNRMRAIRRLRKRLIPGGH